SDGGVGDLQMSLHKAVNQTVDAPYRDVGYYAEITQPTPNLVGFFARIARRLASAGEAVALYHLDQGMGGGKSHALVGLYHMAANPNAFFATELGKEVLSEAKAGGAKIDITGSRVVTLTADYFSPGKPMDRRVAVGIPPLTQPEFGPEGRPNATRRPVQRIALPLWEPPLD